MKIIISNDSLYWAPGELERFKSAGKSISISDFIYKIEGKAVALIPLKPSVEKWILARIKDEPYPEVSSRLDLILQITLDTNQGLHFTCITSYAGGEVYLFDLNKHIFDTKQHAGWVTGHQDFVTRVEAAWALDVITEDIARDPWYWSLSAHLIQFQPLEKIKEMLIAHGNAILDLQTPAVSDPTPDPVSPRSGELFETPPAATSAPVPAKRRGRKPRNATAPVGDVKSTAHDNGTSAPTT